MRKLKQDKTKIILTQKQGAASIYMVVVCALLFSVITAGFVVLMVNENSKSGENDLSQSAYQSSLAGVEDTKMAIQKYYSCLSDTTVGNCDKIKDEMELSLAVNGRECKEKLESLVNILSGRTKDDNGILIKESTDGIESVLQAYTCIDINLNPTDYLATLNQTSPQRLIPLNTKGANKDIEYVKVSWYSLANLGSANTQFENIDSNNKPIFKSADNNGISVPPVLVAQFYQTQDGFSIDSLDSSTEEGSRNRFNNRGTLWLIPSDLASNPTGNGESFFSDYYESYGIDNNKLKNNAFVKSNNHSDNVIHDGFPVRCAKKDETSDTNGYLCSVYIGIPEINMSGATVNRSRQYGTFLLSLSLPYQQPDTDIKVEMYADISGGPIAYDQVQVIIDSTGRANDVYSRTESRIEFYDSSFPFPDYAMTLGSNDGTSLQKTFSVSGEKSRCWSYNSGNTNNEVDDCSL